MAWRCFCPGPGGGAVNGPGSASCGTCGLPRASRAWPAFRDAVESLEPCRAARRYDRRSARVQDRELDAKLARLQPRPREGPAPRRARGLDPTRRNPDLPSEVVQEIFEWTHGYATVEDAAWVARIPYLLCVGGWTHATIVTDPHRGALEQDRLEAEIAALKAKKAFLVLKLRGARAREWLRQNRGRRHMRSIELCKNLEHAPAVVRARDAVLENAARLDATRAYLVARRGLDHAYEMLTKDKKGADCVPPRKGPRAPSWRRTGSTRWLYAPAS